MGVVIQYIIIYTYIYFEGQFWERKCFGTKVNREVKKVGGKQNSKIGEGGGGGWQEWLALVNW